MYTGKVKHLLTGIDSFQVLVGEEKQIVWKEMGK
jgi:hypothetical protein